MSIEIRNITKTFGSFKALDNVSLDLPKGELVALLGPSGCGKTSLLRIIAGLENPDNGQIVIEGVDATNRHVRDRHVGFVFQHYALFRYMNIFENIAFGLRVKPRKARPAEKEIRKRVETLLDLVQLGWLKDRYPSQLSGGQRQRVALARALAVEPQLLLLDEPFGALDAKVRKELRRWLRHLHDDLNISSIFVTHDQEEALEIADRIILMNKGRVEQTGSPREIYDKPKTPFAYSFIGTVNTFKGKMEGDFIRIGADLLPHKQKHYANGQSVVAYARPHESLILKDGPNVNGIAAKINRVLTNGNISRVELVANGPQRQESKEYFEVEIDVKELNTLNLQNGQHVKIQCRYLSLFHDEI